MKLTTNYEPLLASARRAFDEAVDDTLEDARRHAPRRTGTFADSLRRTAADASGDRLEARIGSPLASARAKEKGAYIEARGDHLAIPMPDGSMRKPRAVRIPARPTVVPAGRRFPEHMTRRLRKAAR